MKFQTQNEYVQPRGITLHWLITTEARAEFPFASTFHGNVKISTIIDQSNNQN